MTITDNGRVEVDDETLARGRELMAGGRMPGKREMQKHLGKAWPTVNAVLTKLSDEARQATEQRRRDGRQAMRRLTSRKRSGRVRLVLPERQRSVNEIVFPATLTSYAEPEFEAASLTVQEHPEPEPVTVNEAPVYAYAAPIGPMPDVQVARPSRRPVTWPLVLLALPAFAAVWSGWVGLGGLTGFGVVQPFPGIPGLDGVRLDTAITLPIGVETYGAYALYVCLSRRAVTKLARQFAMWSAIGSLAFGAAGQVAYHRMVSTGMTHAPWPITTAVSCLPVLVLGMGAALRHLVHAEGVND